MRFMCEFLGLYYLTERKFHSPSRDETFATELFSSFIFVKSGHPKRSEKRRGSSSNHHFSGALFVLQSVPSRKLT